MNCSVSDPRESQNAFDYDTTYFEKPQGLHGQGGYILTIDQIKFGSAGPNDYHTKMERNVETKRNSQLGSYDSRKMSDMSPNQRQL
jgi:hypothetical protein